MPTYRVYIRANTSNSVVVEAKDEDEAEQKAIDEFVFDYDFIDVEDIVEE